MGEGLLDTACGAASGRDGQGTSRLPSAAISGPDIIVESISCPVPLVYPWKECRANRPGTCAPALKPGPGYPAFSASPSRFSEAHTNSRFSLAGLGSIDEEDEDFGHENRRHGRTSSAPAPRSDSTAGFAAAATPPSQPQDRGPESFHGTGKSFGHRFNDFDENHRDPRAFGDSWANRVPQDRGAASHAFSPAGYDPSNHGPHNGATAPGGRRDPPWDSHRRDGFNYLQPPARVRAVRRQQVPRIADGSTWTHLHVPPNNAAHLIDPDTFQVVPWHAPRPPFGVIVNFPVQSPLRTYDRELYISAVAHAHRFDPSREQREFVYNFPSFHVVSGTDVRDALLPYHDSVVEYCLAYRIPCPPAHTYVNGNMLGTYLPFLPPDMRNSVQSFYPALLAMALKSKTANLLKYPELEGLLRTQTDGYRILFALATHAGHPALVLHPRVLAIPIQGQDTSLVAYAQSWICYVNYAQLDGRHLSDRYFLQQFIGGMTPGLQDTIGRDLESFASQFGLQGPLPGSFSPAELITTVQQLADHRRHHGLIWKSPRQLTQANLPVRELSFDAPVDTSEMDGLTSMIAALQGPSSRRPDTRTPAGRTCYFCGKDGHFLNDCPLFKQLLGDPGKAATVLRALLATFLSSKGRQSGRHASNDHAIRQIENALSDIPGEETADLPVPDDEAQADSSPPDAGADDTGSDFRQARS